MGISVRYLVWLGITSSIILTVLWSPLVVDAWINPEYNFDLFTKIAATVFFGAIPFFSGLFGVPFAFIMLTGGFKVIGSFVNYSMKE